MSRKPENTFIDGLHNHVPLKRRPRSAKARLKHPGLEIHYEKMNNPYSSGTADSWYSGNTGDLWVEYKYVDKLPVRVPLDVTKLLSDLQLLWLDERYDEGRNVAVIVGCSSGGILFTQRAWHTPVSPHDIQMRILSKVQLAYWIMEQTVL